MATKKEIKEHLKIALDEIGAIVPWYNKEFKVWIFSHAAYPVEYAGDSKAEVIQNFPLYLYDFIEERLNENLSSLTAQKTLGRGGKREGSGRPKGSFKQPTKRITLPRDIAEWITAPGMITHLRALGLSHRYSPSRKLKKSIQSK